ncbi:MAG: hypothetical protein ACOYNR_16555 [Blastocatellia bacterium]
MREPRPIPDDIRIDRWLELRPLAKATFPQATPHFLKHLASHGAIKTVMMRGIQMVREADWNEFLDRLAREGLDSPAQAARLRGSQRPTKGRTQKAEAAEEVEAA